MSQNTESAKDRKSCPKCGSTDVRRSRSEGFFPYLLSLLGRWPFRCRSCRAKFYKHAPEEQEEHI